MWAVVLVPLTIVLSSGGQSLGATEGTGSPSSRRALVIGNSNYRFISTLANPANDASDMAAILRATPYRDTLSFRMFHLGTTF